MLLTSNNFQCTVVEVYSQKSVNLNCHDDPIWRGMESNSVHLFFGVMNYICKLQFLQIPRPFILLFALHARHFQYRELAAEFQKSMEVPDAPKPSITHECVILVNCLQTSAPPWRISMQHTQNKYWKIQLHIEVMNKNKLF